MVPARWTPGLLVFSLLLGSCSVHGLDADPPALSESERGLVDAQVDRALEDEDWESAWNQAADAGLGRERLEEIALAASADRASVAEGMIEKLQEKYGGFSEKGRKRAAAVSLALAEDGKWKWAARVLVMTADDAPTYALAWEVYGQAPPDKAQEVLEVIVEARSEATESEADEPAGDDHQDADEDGSAGERAE